MQLTVTGRTDTAQSRCGRLPISKVEMDFGVVVLRDSLYHENVYENHYEKLRSMLNLSNLPSPLAFILLKFISV